MLGLALTAALWWAYFGVEDDERAERAMLAADPAVRPALALAAYFYAYIPMLLGIVALASGSSRPSCNAGSTLPPGCAWPWAAASALFLAGGARVRHALGSAPNATGWPRRSCCLAVSAVGVTLSVAAEIALLTVIVAAALAVEQAATSVDA